MMHCYDPNQLVNDIIDSNPYGEFMNDIVDSMPYDEFLGDVGEVSAGVTLDTGGVRATASGSLLWIVALVGLGLFAKHKGWV
jgi:hypothetical protein